MTYNHDEWQRRTFDIQIDGQLLKQQTVERRGPLRFFDVEYAVPPEMIQGKTKTTVRFQATGGNETAAVFGIRLIRPTPRDDPDDSWRPERGRVNRCRNSATGEWTIERLVGHSSLDERPKFRRRFQLLVPAYIF